jgi:hypothetical protein
MNKKQTLCIQCYFEKPVNDVSKNVTGSAFENRVFGTTWHFLAFDYNSTKYRRSCELNNIRCAVLMNKIVPAVQTYV